jgi:class 3 adenylate cyclase/tetratricopeptide (TPR) repeat protein
MDGQPTGRRESQSALVKIAPFVGRSQELSWIERWLQEASGGRPRVVLIQGDAGIGKTRLLYEARAIAARLGMQVCFGRCHEDLALPYLPFIESLRPQLEALPDEARQALGPDFDIIRNLLYGAGTAGAAARTPGPAQADHEKLQLLLAMGNAVVKLAQACPSLVIIDDVHWADALSLDLFEHLAFTVSDMAAREPVPMLIIGTHRPVAANERLAHLTARIQREEICRTFTLAGLSEGEIRELLGGLGLRRPSHQLVATVTDATQGNPLFVQEVLHHLVRQDALQEQGGYLVTATAPIDFKFPEQMTAATLTRAHGVSDACRRVLTLASFLGDRFSLKALSVVSAVNDNELLNLLEEAMRHQILRGEGDTFSFAHPLMRHVFYQEASAPRRQRLHKQIADSLGRLYADDADLHLLEVAHHVVRAGPAADTATVLDYARRAGDRAFRVFAWNDAARYYEAALAAGEATSRLSTASCAELHYRAGLAHYYDQDVGPCLHHYDQAIEAYRLIGDVRGLAQALMEKTRTSLAIVPLGTVADLQPLDDVLAALGEREPGLRGHIVAVMAEAYRNGRQAEKAKQRGQQALEIGRQLDDAHLCAYASFALGLAHINDLDVRQALDCWENALVYARRADDVIREGRALHRMPLALTLLGRLGEADAVAVRACESTRTSHDWGNYSLGLSHRASVAVARGEFDLVEGHAHETIVMVSRSRFPWGGFRALLALACARALRGAWTEAHDALDVLVEPGRVFDDAGPIVQAFARVFRQLLRAYSDGGDVGLDPLMADVMKVIGTDTYSLAPLCALIELSDFAGVPAVAEEAVRRLARAAERGVVFSSGWMFLLPRVFGVAATLGRSWDAASGHFREAIDVATAAGARPELARTYLDYARMLIAQRGDGSRTEAADLVKGAASIFAELGMSPFARRADALARALHVDVPAAPAEHGEYPDDLSDREVEVLIRMARGRTRDEIAGDLILGHATVAGHVRNIFQKINVGDEAGATAYVVEKGLAAEPPAVVGGVGPSLRIILVSDVVASSALIHRSGDAKAHDLMQRHNALLRQCLAAHQGTEVTHTGDGIEASFSAASNAVDCAVAIQKGCARHNREHPTDGIHVRIGLNAGEPIATEGRLFGAAVHAAFAICARAGPGQILVSDVVAQLTAGKGFRVINHGRVALKGLGRTRLHEIVWQDTV